MHPTRLLPALVLLTAAGCAQQAATTAAPTPITAATASPQATTAVPARAGNNGSLAARCSAPFRYNEQFYVNMTTSNEGAACSVNAYNNGSGRNSTGARNIYTAGSVTSSPQHGAVTFRFTPEASYIDYTPTAGYVGPDHFTVLMTPGTRPWTVNATVVAR